MNPAELFWIVLPKRRRKPDSYEVVGDGYRIHEISSLADQAEIDLLLREVDYQRTLASAAMRNSTGLHRAVARHDRDTLGMVGGSLLCARDSATANGRHQWISAASGNSLETPDTRAKRFHQSAPRTSLVVETRSRHLGAAAIHVIAQDYSWTGLPATLDKDATSLVARAMEAQRLTLLTELQTCDIKQVDPATDADSHEPIEAKRETEAAQGPIRSERWRNWMKNDLTAYLVECIEVLDGALRRKGVHPLTLPYVLTPATLPTRRMGNSFLKSYVPEHQRPDVRSHQRQNWKPEDLLYLDQMWMATLRTHEIDPGPPLLTDHGSNDGVNGPQRFTRGFDDREQVARRAYFRRQIGRPIRL